MKPVTIYVTEDDIADGTRGDFYTCPVAIAIKRALREAGLKVAWLAVSARLIEFNRVGFKDDEPEVTVEMPEEGMDFIEWYDFEYDVQPIEFTIRLEDSLFA